MNANYKIKSFLNTNSRIIYNLLFFLLFRYFSLIIELELFFKYAPINLKNLVYSNNVQSFYTGIYFVGIYFLYTCYLNNHNIQFGFKETMRLVLDAFLASVIYFLLFFTTGAFLGLV
jgi:hypothetical protein